VSKEKNIKLVELVLGVTTFSMAVGILDIEDRTKSI
jgi:hypothetical protein